MIALAVFAAAGALCLTTAPAHRPPPALVQAAGVGGVAAPSADTLALLARFAKDPAGFDDGVR